MKPSRSHPTLLTLGLALCLGGAPARADHGPGGAGGGVATVSAETLARGTFSISLGFDHERFENVDEAEGLERAAASGDHVDAIDRSLIGEVALSYGVTERLEVGLATGHYVATAARIYDAGLEDPEEEPAVHGFDPDGVTDLWLNAKFRLHRSSERSSALFGGVKAPTGKDGAVDSEGVLVEPSSRAGTGAWDAAIGFAHTERFSARLRMDTSVKYTWHQHHDDYRIGDRIDAGVALCYRVSLKHLPRFYLLGELNARSRQRNEEGAGEVANSGGQSYFATAGMVTQLSERVSLLLAGVAPVLQDLNGDQVQTRLGLKAQVSFEF